MNSWNKTFAEKGRLFGTDPSALVVEALKLWKPSREVPHALDIGAFTGRNALFLARNGFKVIALDPAAEPLKDLQAQANAEGLSVDVQVGTLERYEWSKQFDCIICVNVLHVLSPEDATRAIHAMKQHTVPGGINVVTAFTSKPFEDQKKVFAHNELKQAYTNWEILHYEERKANLAVGGTAEVADIIAKKPLAK